MTDHDRQQQPPEHLDETAAGSPPERLEERKKASQPPPWLAGVRAWQEVAEGERRAKMEAFLSRYAASGRVAQSCRAVGIDTRTHQRWVVAHPEYAEAVKEAHRYFVEQLEAEADRRGMEGIEKPVGFYRGTPSAYVREYSDTLLLARLKAEAPEKYAERHELKGTFAHLDMSRLDDEAINRLAAGENPLSVLGPALKSLPAPPNAPTVDAELLDDDQ